MTLRAVGPDEKPKTTKPKTVSQAADKGTTRELLVAMRTRIAKAVEDANTPARDLAALTKRLVEVVRDIEAIDAREAEDRDGDKYEAEDGAFDASAV
jgi:ribosome-binding protein aMBF1 (putative translation factor)